MRFLTANDRPGEHAPSWHAATATPFPALEALEGDAQAEFCVIGGGYAGLSAALTLAEAGRSVILLEAHRIGWGASGRNGGQLGHGPRADIRAYERLVGRADAAKIWDISCAATQRVKDLVARRAIACDLRAGAIEAAWKPAHLNEFRAYADHLARHYGHEKLEVLSAEALRAQLDSPLYHGGLADPEAGHLHPLNLALGLGRAAREAGARLHERSPVIRLEKGRVETARGAVRADAVILACNGYLDDLAPRAGARMMPINNFIAVTEPLDADPIPGGQCVADSKFVLNYFRMTPDNRLLFGGGETYGARFPADIPGFVRPHLERVFPQLSGVRLDYGWGGTLAITRHRAPMFQRLHDRTLAIGGWSGSGIHMGVMGGEIAAQAAMGPSAAWDALSRVPCPPFPGGSALRPVLLALAMRWYALRDRL